MADPEFFNRLNANPMWQQGLAMMRGDSPENALRMSLAQQQQNALMQENQRKERLRRAMGQTLAGGELDMEKIQQIMALDPATGIQLLEYKQKQQQQDRLQRQLEFEESMYADMIGGGVGDSNTDAARAHMMAESDNPMIAGAGKAALDQIEQQRKRDEEIRKSTLPGYKPVEGYTPTSSITNQAAQMLQLKPAYDEALERIKKVIEKHGDSEVFTKLSEDEIDQEFQRLLNLERTVNNTGVLNVGEVPILEKNYATFKPTTLSNRFRSKKDMLKQLDNYAEGRFGLIDSTVKGLGFEKTGKEYKPKFKTGGKSKPSLTPEQALEILKQRRSGAQ